MKREDAEEFTQSLGQIVAGSWRQIALAKRLGVPQALGLTVEDWVTVRLGGYVKYSVAERREAIKELAADGLSNRAIAEVIGVDETTVRRDNGAANAALTPGAVVPPLENGSDGAAFAAPVDALAALAAAGQINHRAHGSGESEWYTPADIIARVREVLGEIDLDPASCAEANETVQAARFYTEADDGLSREWHGRVWLNPPYSRDSMPAFAQKLIEEYQSGRTSAAMLVSHNVTETRWFQSLAAVASAICFPATRIRFYRGENVASPVNGQAFFYLGEETTRFLTVFCPLGIVVNVCRTAVQP